MSIMIILAIIVLVFVLIWALNRRRRRGGRTCIMTPAARRVLEDTNDLIERVQARVNECPRINRVVFAVPIMRTIDRYADQIARDDMFMNLRLHGIETMLMNDYNVPLVHVNDRREERRDLYVANSKADPKVGESKLNTIDRVTKQSITHTSDAQNVHDSDVQTDIKRIAAKLDMRGASQHADPAVLDYILNCGADSDLKQKAIEAYDTIRTRGINIAALNATEPQILNAVWQRANSPVNTGNQDSLKMALVDALASCIEGGRPVCSTGRSSRVISSLCMLDADSDISKIGTSEMYKNEILEKANGLLKECIKTAQNSPNLSMQTYGKSFEDASILDDTVPENVKTEFKDMYAAKLDLLSSEYKEHWSPRIKDELLQVI